MTIGYECHRPQQLSGADLSAKVGYFAKRSGVTWVLGTAAASEGVIVNGGSASGDKVEVAVVGVVTVIAGTTITSGQFIMSDSSGTAAVGTGNDRFGVAITGGSSGDEIRAFIWGAEL
jgi:hypothetical protein